jgi:tRNA threonylcarbamoyl adenosine modification protein (Sua5/YciO/YrdC/YwlC family)
MLLEINPYAPTHREIKEVVEVLKKGGIIIYPSDSVYSFGCSLDNKKALDKLIKLKGGKVKNTNISIICQSVSEITEYVLPLSRVHFKIINKALPGPYTFIFPSKKEVSKLFGGKKNTVGIRIPNHQIPIEIVSQLGGPIATVSLHDDDEIKDYTTDPMEIANRYEDDVDIIIDGGYGNIEPTSVVNLCQETPEVLREGSGEIFF